MISKGQIEAFLEEKLNFLDWKATLDRNRTEFLYKVVAQYGLNICYENVTWGSMKPEERKCPTLQDAKDQIFQTNGGACLHLNYFLKLLLEKLDYRVYMICGEALAMAIPRNHFALVVEVEELVLNGGGSGENADGAEMQLYLVDVGFGRPITSPVNLNKLPYVGQAGGFKFEMRFNPEKRLYERVLFGGCAIKGKFETESEERVEVIFELKPQEYRDFEETYDIIFTDPSRSFFLNTLFLFRFISIESTTKFNYVCFRGKSIALGSEDEREETKFDSYMEMLPVIQKWFPLLNTHTVKQALANYDLKSNGKS